jgi:hypothetical protein
MGVAVVSAQASLDAAAEAIADDVVPFDQRGCLSPRVVVAIGNRARAESLAERLAAALDRAGARVPRGALADDEREAAARYAQAIAFAGHVIEGGHAVVGVSDALTVPPTGRHVHVTFAPSESAAAATLAPVARFVVAVGADTPDLARSVAPAYARLSALGAMQRPALDGPVDLR